MHEETFARDGMACDAAFPMRSRSVVMSLNAREDGDTAARAGRHR